MILEKEKREAWLALCECIARGQIQWPEYLSQEQIDYVTTCIDKNAFPGLKGRTLRSVSRWNNLDFAFEIFKARQPDLSDRKIYEAVAKHYGCSWTTVRNSRQKMRKQEFSFAGRHKQLGFETDDFVTLTLPHISFDNFTDE